VRGRIDRVDRFQDGSLRVVDYKTGQARYYEKKAGEPPFAGGRRIQAGVYAHVVEGLYGRHVRSFEYRFPTSRGEHQAVPYDRTELDEAAPVIVQLLDTVQSGLFLATDDSSDCGFCAYREICRVSGRGEDTQSPPAAWSREHAEALEEYAILRRLRQPR
jgi:RecB family exonuclease